MMIREAINTLAEDPAAIIRQEGIKGLPADQWNCPIARYLNQKVGGQNWFVSYGLKDDKPIAFTVGQDGDTYELPDSVRLFLKEFDGRAYPDLVAANSEEVELELIPD